MCVRTSTAFYGNFILDMDRSPGFGSARTDYKPTLRRPALLRLGFPSAPDFMSLTLPVPAARRTVLQKVRGCAYKALPQFVNTGFQVLFHSPPGVLFTFPSRYYTLSVTKSYLALRDGPRIFPPDSSCPVVLWIPTTCMSISPTGLSPSLLCLSRQFDYRHAVIMWVRNPFNITTKSLGSSNFARHYSRNR